MHRNMFSLTKYLRCALLVLGLTASCFAVHSCRSRAVEASGFSRADDVRYAEGFRIDEGDGYTSVTVRDPWDTLKILDRYILVDRDSALPDSLPSGTLVRVPVTRAAVYTSVHAAIMEQLGCIGSICGVCEPEYLTSAEIRSRVEDGTIADLGSAMSPNVEKIIDLDADAIILPPYENTGYGVAEKTGIPIIKVSDYTERHPLGRTEWVKFLSLLLCREAEGDSIFSATEAHYNGLKELAASVGSRPTVLLERKIGSAWYLPSGTSYIATLHRDAGADYVYADRASQNNIPLSFEEVYNDACGADYWLLKYEGQKPYTYEDLKHDYQPYAGFDAYKNRKIYTCNTVRTSYYDDIVLRPDLILEDFIAIYHPELLPGHVFRYYFPME